MFALRLDGSRSAYIRQACACRPCTHEKALLTVAGGVTHNHINVVGQRIVRSLIRHDFMICYYRTGRFHCLKYL